MKGTVGRGGVKRKGQDARAEQPPSTSSSVPVTYEDASLARKSAAIATSSGRPKRPVGQLANCFCRSSAESSSTWNRGSAMATKQAGAEVRPQRVDPQFLERTVGTLGLVLVPAAGGASEAEPVGRPVTGAAKTLRLEAENVDGAVQLRVIDDGQGFDALRVPRALSERAAAVGARLALESRPGRTVVQLDFG